MAEYAVHACRTGSPSMEIYSPGSGSDLDLDLDSYVAGPFSI